MTAQILPIGQHEPKITPRAECIYRNQLLTLHRRTDRLFAILLVLQWVGGVTAALWISPRTWAGPFSDTHPHVWAAVLLGGLLTSFPVLLAFVLPGAMLTRQVIAVAQMLWSALLIHLTGGRIETHFHVFGSLAFLAFYRDWRVLVTATVVVALDHGLRGLYWPQSVYGVLMANPLRTLEHGAWVVFEDIFLYVSIRQSLQETKDIAVKQGHLEENSESLELANRSLRIEINERKQVECRLLIQHATTSILAESTTLSEATPKILRAVSESLGWSVGALWSVDQQAQVLRCVELSHSQSSCAEGFVAVSREITFAHGTGLPGRIWASGQPAWIADVVQDGNFPRAPIAAKEGLHGAFGFPILLGNTVLGVMEFFSQTIQEPDESLLATMASVGGQIGQFIDRKQAEQALRVSQQRFEAFMNNSPALAFLKDENGRYVYVNKQAENSFIGQSADMLGKSDADIFSSEVAKRFAENDRAALAANQAVEVMTTTPGPGGTFLHWLTFLFPIADASGRRSLGGMAFDITDRKRTEEALRNTEDQLRQSQKMDAVGQLAGGVAHDFNNLLTIILGYGELLLGRLRSDAKALSFVKEIRLAGERASSLTRQLLAFSRKQVLESKILDLNAIVSDTDKMLCRLIGEDITLTTMLDPDLKPVKADPGQMEQVLLNLAINARDAMPQGGKLTIETTNAYLDDSYAQGHPEVRPGEHVMLAVSDTGCGMDSATKGRIFEPFFTTKGPGKGTGLGLSTVFGIVKQSEGHISVYSEEGRGTAFKIYLPCHKEATVPGIGSSHRLTQAPQGKETILLVEDEDGVRSLSCHVLQLHGYAVLEASHAAEALRVCENHRETIDLLVTDVVMPEMSGRQLAERLAGLRPEMKVMYMSGYTTDAVVRHGVLDAETVFLQKPFTTHALAHKVREVLDQKTGVA